MLKPKYPPTFIQGYNKGIQGTRGQNNIVHGVNDFSNTLNWDLPGVSLNFKSEVTCSLFNMVKRSNNLINYSFFQLLFNIRFLDILHNKSNEYQQQKINFFSGQNVCEKYLTLLSKVNTGHLKYSNVSSILNTCEYVCTWPHVCYFHHLIPTR